MENGFICLLEIRLVQMEGSSELRPVEISPLTEKKNTSRPKCEHMQTAKLKYVKSD